MIEGLNEASNELGELAAGSEEAEERYLSPDRGGTNRPKITQN